jgi:hypothetical protein
LERALRQVVAAHPALRTTIQPGRCPTQLVHPAGRFELVVHDASEGGQDEVGRVLRQELATRLDPTRHTMRVVLYRLRPHSHLLLIKAHHVVTDLWSSNIVLEDLATALDRPGERISDRHSWDYATFSRWERKRLEGGDLARQQRYWHERLAGMSTIPTPLGDSRADGHGSTGLIEASLDRETAAGLEHIRQRTRSSSFAVLLAVLYCMTWRTSQDRDLAVASLFANRSRPELQRTVGFLVNLLMLRVRVRSDASFLDFVTQSQRAVTGALANGDLPYHALSPMPPAVRQRGNARADDFVFHAIPERIDRTYQAGPLRLCTIVPDVVGRFDLELAVRPTRESILARLTFNERRLDGPAARAFLRGYIETAQLVAVAPERRVRELGCQA